MSLFSIQARKHTAYYDHLLATSRTPARERLTERKAAETPLSKSGISSGDSVCDSSRSSDKGREINRTYVISALSKSGSGQQTPRHGRLTLQRRSRKTGAENAEKTMGDSSQNSTPAPEKRLTLQRRSRTRSAGKNGATDVRKGAQESRWVTSTDQKPTSKVLSESNSRTLSSAGLIRSVSLRETAHNSKARETAAPVVESTYKMALSKTPSYTGRQQQDKAKTFATPTRTTQFEKIAARKDVFEKLAAKEVQSAGLQRPKFRTQQAEDTKPVPAPRVCKAPAGVQNTNAAPQVRKTSSVLTSTQNEDVTVAKTSTPAPIPAPAPTYTDTSVRPSEVPKRQDSLKMENSAVTVAVRVRPFSVREKAEKAQQVVFMNKQETTVQHPDSKQSYSFTYDFSFCSIDETDPEFASQQTVYETLAKPLLERAFEGFNTCLFAYGQTGSGKSYTMMGFGEEAGMIPRFCQELFSRLSSTENQEVTCHLEMSYFEVYNEKIHDLLTQLIYAFQLRVREHPVHGPYVAELSGWLELGNKQRATAATGMNDKSSRSHSVFTLVMTQTKTECVEGEEHDHRITSRINLVDLAGSERCNSAQTSGDRLREGASINRSLLTLGKVICALSEQALSRRKVFIPYRESVLTWLLKESLGGNSKTAMIATLSPAASSVEESLSTLRYSQQARMIINLAKVNEDTNARLIRELKAEVEKLRAAQMSSQGVEPERVRLFQQEIVALKSKLSQQEREIAEAHRAWREKLEQAEIRKREEAKELQRAGVTFKVDNRLPNLVNLNEDPQLSEMLLYMIKEGQTRVGKLKSESAHDIQLVGALIADQHCVISNIKGTVSVTPMENAKTFVNGNLISESTVLHHGDRLILGGDHYFRFNHPTEVQSGKRVSCWTGSGDGQKDFEFAKNELLSAQRAEIEEAHVKAKEEMMQGIQMAKEVAQKELSEQKALYEDRIRTLERELHRSYQAKIVDALEAEKKKLSKDLEQMQKKRALRENHTPRNVPPQWDTMKLSLMIEEANKISAKLKKNTVFSRYEKPYLHGDLQVRVQNTKLGITTFWSLDKFQNNMAAMRELDQGDPASKDDDVFYGPDDEWEQDLSTPIHPSFNSPLFNYMIIHTHYKHYIITLGFS
uniref:Kinesin-like protein KIF14 n=1 Tax=Myripristis murdjan TaxID=586833 RepID=A0A667X2U9_9TELE